MNDSTREIAFRFAQVVSRHDPLYVVLYGSAARGTDTETSDLDFLVVFDTEELEEDALRDIGRSASALEAQHDRPVEVVFANRDHRGLDPYYVEKVFGEGVLLYARQPDVTLNGAPVRPRAILSFSLEKATEAERAALRRRLWGDGRASETPGLLARLKALTLADSVVMVPTDGVGEVERALSDCHVPYAKTDVWLPA